MEEEVIREASAVVFVTDETADLTMAKYPDAWRRKVAVVPHGFDPSIAPAAPEPHDPRRPLRIVHTGRFYAGVRTPLPMLRALAALNARALSSGEMLADAIDVTFVGPHTTAFQRDAAALGVGSFVHFRDRVPPADAAAIAASADVLLVIDAPSGTGDAPSVFLPSKLVDYLPLRKPIFGITPDHGASARVLRRLGCPTVPPGDEAAIAAALDALVGRWRAGMLAVGAAFDHAVTEFDIRRTARLLDDVLISAFAGV